MAAIRFRSRRLIACLLALGLAAGACGGGDDDAGGDAPSGGDQPVAGGSLRYGWVTETPHLFPGNTPFGGIAAIGGPERMAIYDALVVLNSESALEYRLAESLATSDNGATWDLKLRANVKFSDDTPFDAAAVKYNWEDVAKPGSGSAAAAAVTRKIASTEVVDTTTLRIKLPAPNPNFPRDLAQTALIYIGSPTAMQAKGQGFGTAPVGAGAYTLKEWVRGDHMTLVRNPKFHGKTYLDEIVIRPIGDEQQRLNTLTTGALDVMYTLNTATTGKVLDGGYKTVIPALSGGSNIVFNVTKAPFNDVRARQALAYALDSKELNQALYGGKGEPASGLFHPKSPHYTGPDLPKPDAGKAQQLFDELAREGKPVDFTLTSIATITQDQSEWVQAKLSSFKNVKVKVDALPGPQASQAIQGTNFQAIHVTAPKFVDPYPSLTSFLLSTSPGNYGKYNSPAMDAAVKQLVAAAGKEAEKKALEGLVKEYNETVPFLTTLRVTSTTAFDDKKVGGVKILSDGLIDWVGVWKRA